MKFCLPQNGTGVEQYQQCLLYFNMGRVVCVEPAGIVAERAKSRGSG